MLNRQLAGLGIHPAAGYILSLIVFILFSILLFAKTDLAAYFYLLAAVSLLSRFSESRRNYFLKSVFSNHGYFKIRVIENNIVSFPFVIFLACKTLFIPALALVIISSLLGGVSFRSPSRFTIPTPFFKWPFEFAVGFRNTYFLFLLAYFLAVMSVPADNFNLGIFSLLLVFLVSITFYFNPEEVFYVWIYNLGPGKFLWRKIMAGLLHATMLCLPVAIFLVILFPDKIYIILAFLALGYIYLATVILAKYSSFPDQVSLPQFIILALSVWFPPLLAAIIPYFYLQSVKRLNMILE